jgi:hypothetical protein
VPVTAAASDSELIELLRHQGGLHDVHELSRRPYRYATSAPIEEIRVRRRDGTETALLLKDLSRDRLLGDARTTKPAFLHQPRREIETYRGILAPAGIGPRCFGVVSDSDEQRHWLVIERVPGVELWQVGELSVWEVVARWLGEFHAAFAGRIDDARAANPYLLELSGDWFRSWSERARAALAESPDPRAAIVGSALERYDEVATSLAALPRTFVHGELYPSNVLVVREEQPLRVCPVDWEMAGIGPGLVDLAALVGGWAPEERSRLVSAYVDAGTSTGGTLPRATLETDLARCRLHLALQWLGWCTDWQPPREHAHDWTGEALELTRELGLA